MDSFWTASVAPFFWGLMLLASLMGWGELVRMRLGISTREANWGLRGGWGMALVLAIGGMLQLAHRYDALALEMMVGAGAGAFLFRLLLDTRKGVARRWMPWAPPAVALAIVYVLSVKAHYLNHWDDYPAYLVYAKDLLANGFIDQPFSLRRLLTYGGQQQLDAMLLLHGSERNIDLLELGICRILFVAIIAGIARPRGTKQRALAAIFLTALVFIPREHLPIENIHSEMTGLVLFLTLLRTLLLAVARPRAQMLGLAAVAAIVGAAASAMRVSNLPAAVFMIAFYYLARAIFDRRNVNACVGQLLFSACVFAVVLLPWSLVLSQTSGTLLYPLWPGTQRPEYNYLAAPLNGLQTFTWVTGFAVQPMKDHTPMGLVMLLPLLLALHRRHRRVELPLAFAAVLTGIMILRTFTFGWYDTMYRYIFPFTFCITAALLYRAILRPPVLRLGGTSRAFLALFARPDDLIKAFVGFCVVLLLIFHVPQGLAWTFVGKLRIPEPEPGKPQWRLPIEAMEFYRETYREAQAKIPAGEPIFVATSFPTHFDFRRNRILIADIPGAASPAPGMPLFDGPQAMMDYLRSKGIHYVVYSRGDNVQNMYSGEFWRDVQDHPNQATPDILNVARFNVAFLKDLEGLRETQTALYRDQSLVVIHLRD